LLKTKVACGVDQLQILQPITQNEREGTLGKNMWMWNDIVLFYVEIAILWNQRVIGYVLFAKKDIINLNRNMMRCVGLVLLRLLSAKRFRRE
jgi:hypothetical protein